MEIDDQIEVVENKEEPSNKDYYDEVYFDSDQESESAGIGLMGKSKKESSKKKKKKDLDNVLRTDILLKKKNRK